MSDTTLTESITPKLDTLSMQELEQLYIHFSDYKSDPIEIEEFVDNDKYLGNYFQGKLRPYWRDVLKDIYPSPCFSPYWLVSFRGAIGIGKTTIACTGICYDLKNLIDMTSPQRTFDLIPTTKIIFAIYNMTLALATDVIWDQLTQMFMASPYFRGILGPKGTKNKGSGETLFPNRIEFSIGSRFGHSLGQAVFEAVIDEANFEVIKGQVRESFNSLLRRMESRFMKDGGGFPGKVWMISSETSKASVMNKIVDDYRKSEGVLVVQEPLWVIQPEKYKLKTFPVYAGSETRPAKIIKDSDMELLDLEPENCIDVPEEHREAFEGDIDAALRDLAGRAIGSSYRLFKQHTRLHTAMRVSPIWPDTFIIDFDNDDDQISSHCLVPEYFKNPIKKFIPRYIHIDIAISGDRFGVASSYISDFIEIKFRDPYTFGETIERLPVVVTEWAFAMEPTPGKQIPIFKIRTFIDWLSKNNYVIGGISADGFQSTDTLQILRHRGYTAELLSVDKTSVPYIQYRNLVYQKRGMFPINNVLMKELNEVEMIQRKSARNIEAMWKIDHPEGGSKDIADAVVGSAFKAVENVAKARFLMETMKNPVSQTGGMSSELFEAFWPGRNK